MIGTFSSTFRHVSRQRPCRICKRPNAEHTSTWCAYRIDGSHSWCAWKLNRYGGHTFRHDDTEKASAMPQRERPSKTINWVVLNDHYVACTQTDALNRFAESMGLQTEALRALDTGWDGEAWTTPMRNGRCRIVGIQRRFPDGTKRCVTGSRCGLFIPARTLERENDAIYLTEGASDTAAVVGLGLPAVGLFNAGGNVDQICEMFQGRSLILIADNDPPAPKGFVGGYERTQALCERLRRTGFDLAVIRPPAKDAREAIRLGWRP